MGAALFTVRPALAGGLRKPIGRCGRAVEGEVHKIGIDVDKSTVETQAHATQMVHWSPCPSPEAHAGDRAMLAEFLPESLEPSTDDRVDAAWCAETEWRMHARDQGTVEAGKWAAWLVVNDNL